MIEFLILGTTISTNPMKEGDLIVALLTGHFELAENIIERLLQGLRRTRVFRVPLQWDAGAAGGEIVQSILEMVPTSIWR